MLLVSLQPYLLLVLRLRVVLRLRAEAEVPIRNRCGWMSCKCPDIFPLPQSSSLGSWRPTQRRRITVARCEAWGACPLQLSRVLLTPRAMLLPECSHLVISLHLDQSSLGAKGGHPVSVHTLSNGTPKSRACGRSSLKTLQGQSHLVIVECGTVSRAVP